MISVIEIANFFYKLEIELSEKEISMYKLSALVYFSQVIYKSITEKLLFFENIYLYNKSGNWGIYIPELEYEDYINMENSIDDELKTLLIDVYDFIGVYTDYGISKVLTNDTYINSIDKKDAEEIIKINTDKIKEFYKKV